MKKLMIAVVAAGTISAFAGESKDEGVKVDEPSIFSFYADYGFYSGYQLYGSLLNRDPVLEGYAEVRAKLAFDDWDFGSVGFGVWHNTDLTGRRANNGNFGECSISRRAFNEVDPNLSWQKTFWFDDDNTIGLDYRMSFIWYWYPHNRASGDHAQYTTMDWNHSFALINPIVVPYVNFVHEYHESNGNLIQFGLKREFTFAQVEGLKLTPFIEGVWRNRNYGWCFANYGNEPDYSDKLGAGLATVKLELDAEYWFTGNIGVFAKVAYCTTVDPNLREAASSVDNSNPAHFGNSVYGADKDFVWGGFGLKIAF